MDGLVYRPGPHGPPILNNGQSQSDFRNMDASSSTMSLPFHGGPPPVDPHPVVNERFFTDPYKGTDEPFTDPWWGTVNGVVLTEPKMTEEAKYEKKLAKKADRNHRLKKELRKDCSRLRLIYDSEKGRFDEAQEKGDTATKSEISVKWYKAVKAYLGHYIRYGLKMKFLTQDHVASFKFLTQEGKPHTEFSEKMMSYWMSICPNEIRTEVVRVIYEDAIHADNAAGKAARRARNRSANAAENSDHHTDYDTDHDTDHDSDVESDIDFGINARVNASEDRNIRVFQGNTTGKDTLQNVDTHESQNTHTFTGIDDFKGPGTGAFENAGARAFKSPNMNIPWIETQAGKEALAKAPWNQGNPAFQNVGANVFQNTSNTTLTKAHTSDGVRSCKRARTDSVNEGMSTTEDAKAQARKELYANAPWNKGNPVFEDVGANASQNVGIPTPEDTKAQARKILYPNAPWNKGNPVFGNVGADAFQNTSNTTLTKAHVSDDMRSCKRARTDSGNDAGAHSGMNSYTSGRHNEHGNNEHGRNGGIPTGPAADRLGRARYGGYQRGGYPLGGYQYHNHQHGAYQHGGTSQFGTFHGNYSHQGALGGTLYNPAYHGGYRYDGAPSGMPIHGSLGHGGYHNGGYHHGGTHQGGTNQGGTNQGGTNQGGAHHGGLHYGGYPHNGTHHDGNRQGGNYMRY